MNKNKTVSKNNRKAWLFKIFGFKPVSQIERIKELIRLAKRDGR